MADLPNGVRDMSSIAWVGEVITTSSTTTLLPKEPLTPPRRSGTASCPITVTSSPPLSGSDSSPSPSPVGDVPRTPFRVRAAPHYSPLAATAMTPPKSIARPSPVRPPLHPFFARPRALPQAGNPQLVATYMSTSESDDDAASAESSFGAPASPTLRQAGTRTAYGPVLTVADKMELLAISDRVGPPAQSLVAGQPGAAISRKPLPRIIPQVRDSTSPATTSFKAGTLQPAGQTKPVHALDSRQHGLVAKQEATLHPSTAKPSTADIEVSKEQLPVFSVRRPLAGHFSHSPAVAYTSDASEADDLVSCLRGPVLGFDLEWPPPGVGPVRTEIRKDGTVKLVRNGLWDATMGKLTWPQGRTAVIQIADAKTVIVFHLDERTRPGPALCSLIADPRRIKVGVSIKGDWQKLVRDWPALFSEKDGGKSPAGMLELSAWARWAEPAGTFAGGRLISLAKLAKHCLGVELDKNEGVRQSAWDRPLVGEQIDYAANDAFVGLLIFQELERRGQARYGNVDLQALSIVSVGGGVSLPPLGKGGKPGGAGVSVSASPAAERAFRLFAEGQNIDELAVQLQVKTSTVRGYVGRAASMLPPESIASHVRSRIVALLQSDKNLRTRYSGLLVSLRTTQPSSSLPAPLNSKGPDSACDSSSGDDSWVSAPSS